MSFSSLSMKKHGSFKIGRNHRYPTGERSHQQEIKLGEIELNAFSDTRQRFIRLAAKITPHGKHQ